MSRNVRRHLSPAAGKTFTETHSDLLKSQDFARRLRELMDERGLKPSELARRAWGEYTDPVTGYKVARKRDRISAYMNARQFPDPENLSAIAKALKIDVKDLAPSLTGDIIERSDPPLYMQESPDGEFVYVKMSKWFRTDDAYALIAWVGSLRNETSNRPPRGTNLPSKDVPAQIDDLTNVWGDLENVTVS